nr:MAG TPA: hypothetical protein [Caudoviricetes sp.]
MNTRPNSSFSIQSNYLFPYLLSEYSRRAIRDS